MNRKLLVTLLHKNIEELNVITDGFMEMQEYPQAIVHLAKRKTEDIQTIIDQLAEINSTQDMSIPDQKTETRNQEDESFILSDDIILESESITEATDNEPVHMGVSEMPMEDPVAAVEIIAPTALNENKSDTHKTTVADKIAQTITSRNDKLSQNDNSISASIAFTKIDDIKQAISIGDRFRFQRELFKGNGEDMNKTLSYINQLATLEEVVSFLQSKYGWEQENEAAEDFLLLVKRKFL